MTVEQKNMNKTLKMWMLPYGPIKIIFTSILDEENPKISTQFLKYTG